MIRLSAFADEISPALDEQIVGLRAETIRHLDLRSVDGTNVLDLTGEQVRTIQRALAAAGIHVAAIASPIGKTSIDASREDDVQRMRRAVDLARLFSAPTIRAFSYYPGADGRFDREEIVERLRTLVALAGEADVTVMHENEKGIYGDTAERCADLLGEVPGLRAAFDPANFLQCGEEPYPHAYDLLRPAIGYVHVKDVAADGSLVPAGRGEAHWPDILAALRSSGYTGVLSLEPHLASAGRFAGFSGPELFHEAATALKGLLDEMGWAEE
ncbi:MAG TPA: sugar phosphate isomerase/epimerase family protein [Chloroflexota bacterium]|nr:sugar phosphate isomerase/epimerase family protein [Chloroflexota bacterium]